MVCPVIFAVQFFLWVSNWNSMRKKMKSSVEQLVFVWRGSRDEGAGPSAGNRDLKPLQGTGPVSNFSFRPCRHMTHHKTTPTHPPAVISHPGELFLPKSRKQTHLPNPYRICTVEFICFMPISKEEKRILNSQFSDLADAPIPQLITYITHRDQKPEVKSN